MTAEIRDLKLTNFRNFETLHITPTHKMIVLTGGNGIGKTNVLEAISLFSPGKGLKGAPLSDLSRLSIDQNHPWAVHAKLKINDQATDIGIGQDPNSKKDKRLVKINGEKAKSQKALADIAQFVWLTPSMDRIWIEGGSERRRFIDRMVFSLDPQHAERVSIYEKTLRERSALLQEQHPNYPWIDQLEAKLVDLGTEIILARDTYIKDLTPHINPLPPLPEPHIILAGTLEDELRANGSDNFKKFYKSQLEHVRSIDKIRGGSRVGPHRTDVQMYDRPAMIPAARASTGEQKTLLFAFVLAHCRLRIAKGLQPPILLLDEVVAHIDPDRRTVFCKEIIDLGLQAWLTGTEEYFFDALKNDAQYVKLG